MRNALLLFLSFLTVGQLTAQTATKRIITINGGQFGNPNDNANISSYDPASGTYTSLDTIQTQSIQDALVDGRVVYVAAQDSLVKYDLVTGDRIAAEAFGAPSTISMALYNDYLLVGNWYAPFGQIGPYQNHFRIFNKKTLAYVDSTPEISQGVKSFVVVGDTAYIGQNYTSSAFSDSAGWMIKVDLATLTYSDSMAVNDNMEDLGRLIAIDGIVYGLNSVSNSITMYDPASGSVMTDTANADLNLRSYGSQVQFDQFGVLHTKFGSGIGTYDPVSRSVIQANIVDTVVTAFTYDTVNQQYYVTQTDFFSYLGGVIYDASGQRVDTFLVGSSPEAIVSVYNELPVANDDSLTALQGVFQEITVLDNDTDLDADSLTVELISYTANFMDTVYVENGKLFGTGGTTGIGYDTVTYVVLDEWGDLDTGVVALFVDSQFSLEDEFPANQVVVAPNPAVSRISVDFMELWEGEVNLIDLNGRLLSTQKVARGAGAEFNLETLPSGVYLLQGNGPEGSWHRKVVKE